MTTLDIVLLIMLVASVATGFWKGIIVQAGSLGGILLGVVLCRLFDDKVTAFIAGSNGAEYTDTILANIILFTAGFIAVKIVAHFCRKVVHALSLGGLDRMAGAAFCLFEWALILSITLNLWILLKPDTDFKTMSSLGNGHAIEAVMELAPAVMGWAAGK